MLRKRIRTNLIPEVIELLETWHAEEGDNVEHLISELQSYAADTSGHVKPYLELDKREDKLLTSAIESLTYWKY